ncbi:radical SAM protein [Thermoplasma sp.]|uniref:radical SAM protein n=1 Tax=Thermoplasma sp. TaxID=1973142 RepID=UPI00127CF740|nr:radical SAM protein [Thermoplasma sp.]KAA8921998.1 MAG: radical SAM protein [Thermoplasma sp.]
MKTMIWNIDYFCNLRCKSCNAWQGKIFFPEDQIDKHIQEMKRNGIKIVSVTGGEPTLNKSVVDIVRKLKENHFFTHIASNGTNPYVLRKLYPYLDAVTISLDSNIPEEHNEYRGLKIFDTVVSTIKEAKNSVKIVTANMLVTNFNYFKVGEIADFANNELGVPLSMCFPEQDAYYFQDFQVTNDMIRQAFKYAYENYHRHVFGNMRSYYQEAVNYLDGKSKLQCKAGQEIFYTDYRGKVHPCFDHVEVVLNKKPEWEIYDNHCSQCFTECFLEPSIDRTFEAASLIGKIWWFNHVKKRNIRYMEQRRVKDLPS